MSIVIFFPLKWIQIFRLQTWSCACVNTEEVRGSASEELTDESWMTAGFHSEGVVFSCRRTRPRRWEYAEWKMHQAPWGWCCHAMMPLFFLFRLMIDGLKRERNLDTWRLEWWVAAKKIENKKIKLRTWTGSNDLQTEYFPFNGRSWLENKIKN